jgi:hypothetical protein
MAILEQVMQWKNQGASDEQIIQELTNQGIPPKQIYDAINQSQIKSAVTNNPMEQYNQEQPQIESNQTYEQPAQEMYPQQGYNQYASTDSNTMIELADQVYEEKIKKVRNQLEGINEFKTITQVKLEHLEESVRKIENTIEKLQLAILDKVGSYGDNLESIKKEMNMMQETFSKTMPSLTKRK